jgi:hypothetical protein
MSDTPRTDKARADLLRNNAPLIEVAQTWGLVAISLERELAEAKAELKECEDLRFYWSAGDGISIGEFAKRIRECLDVMERKKNEAGQLAEQLRAELHSANKLAADRLADLKAQEEQHTRTFAALVEARAELEVARKDCATYNVHLANTVRGLVNARSELVRKDEALRSLISYASAVSSDRTIEQDGIVFMLQCDEWVEGLRDELKEAAAALAQGGKYNT